LRNDVGGLDFGVGYAYFHLPQANSSVLLAFEWYLGGREKLRDFVAGGKQLRILLMSADLEGASDLGHELLVDLIVVRVLLECAVGDVLLCVFVLLDKEWVTWVRQKQRAML